MKPKYSCFDELTDKSSVHNVRVRVIEKSRVFQSPGKKKYQRILLQDLNGSIMKTTLFEDDIQAYEEVIKQKGEYVISNATIRAVGEKYQTKVGELQMNFNNRTVIQPISDVPQDDSPQYHTIASIPRTGSSYDRYDVLGVVVIVRDIQKVKGNYAQENNVCDIIITDHRFSLATTMSYAIISAPTGEKADVLRQWAASHANLLSQKRDHLLKALKPTKDCDISTIAYIKSKTASNTIADDRYWIKAFIRAINYNDIRKFLACNNCNKKTDTEKNGSFDCPWCLKKNSISTARLALTFDAEDDTGSITLTTFTEIIAHLFGKTTKELYEPDSPESLETCEKIAFELRAKPVYIELGPTSALSRNGVLKWVLKSATHEPFTISPPDVHPSFTQSKAHIETSSLSSPKPLKITTSQASIPSPSDTSLNTAVGHLSKPTDPSLVCVSVWTTLKVLPLHLCEQHEYLL